MPDLDTLPGIADLRARTQGDPQVLVAVIDGPPVTSHPVFEGADIEAVRGYWLPPIEAEDWAVGHATHIASVIFGQAGTDVHGLAPRCRGLFIATMLDEDTAESEIGVARAIEYALSRGAQIIHCAACHPNQTGAAQSWMTDAVRKAAAAGAVIVSPAGNDYGENWCVPSTLPEVLAVGALADDGAPMQFTNFGELYEGHSIMGPGENVLGAKVDGSAKGDKGTSVAAPVLTGIVAALTSAVAQSGRAINPQEVRDVLIATARPCTGTGASRCIGGEVAVDRAIAVLLDGLTVEQARVALPDGPAAPDAPAAIPVPPGSADHQLPPHSVARHRATEPEQQREAYQRQERAQRHTAPSAAQSSATAPSAAESWALAPSGAQPSLRYPSLFFGIGEVGYDFGDQRTRDSFLREMDARVGSGDPDDPARMVAYLDAHPDEARRLLWTFAINGERRYFASPLGAWAAGVYDMLAALALASARGEIAVASLPGWTLASTRTAMDGTVLRELRLPSLRGVYGWQAAAVAAESLAAVHRDAIAGGVGQREGVAGGVGQPGGVAGGVGQREGVAGGVGQAGGVAGGVGQREAAEAGAIIAGDGSQDAVMGLSDSPVVSWSRLREEPTVQVRAAVVDFLNQVYYRPGQEPEVSRDRAVNFAATNGYQVAAVFLDAMGDGLRYASHRTEYSPFARVGGNCWDVILEFTDPTRTSRAAREYRMTVDIAEPFPVTVGRLRRWAG